MIKSILSGMMAGAMVIAFLMYCPLTKAEEIPYLDTFYKAEVMYDLPPNLLIEVARQESSFRQEVIDCELNSTSGAMGIMQIMPRHHPSVDPCNPRESILYAARYLRGLRNELGSWVKAVAGYYWGPGNVKKSKYLPRLVLLYVEQVLDRTLSSQPPTGVFEKASYTVSRDSFGTSSLSNIQRLCYAMGSIGYDSVVNKDAGVDLSEALKATSIPGKHSPLISKVVKDAYQWELTPHEYAMKTYAWCNDLFTDTRRL